MIASFLLQIIATKKFNHTKQCFANHFSTSPRSHTPISVSSNCSGQLIGMQSPLFSVAAAELPNLTVWVVLLLLGLLADLGLVQATRCVVSKWRPWTECMGNCDFAQKVRNRDVLRPPFPERHLASGHLFLRECPHLYEKRSGPKHVADNEDQGHINETTSATATTITSPALRHQRPLEREKEDIRKRSKVAGIQVLSSSNANRSLCGHRNTRCCKIERNVCPDGGRPKLIIRWHRQKDEPFCRAFHYPYCGPKYESFDAPIVSENVCTELCFSSEEKTILANLRII
uniref:BPTI/Kunitz inhibitor domain-containing protein n=1 Tax=Ditylenchus dipsaci TaxID=166011 RepID=A0A915EMM3_9BILA